MREFMLNQTEFSEMLGMSVFQYNRYEKNAIQPSLEKAILISNKLNKDVKEIFTLAEE